VRVPEINYLSYITARWTLVQIAASTHYQLGRISGTETDHLVARVFSVPYRIYSPGGFEANALTEVSYGHLEK
jgi:hypothetical protein